MRKFLTIVTGTLISGSVLAGGLVTNTNQSASWVRLPARNASTEVDAAYFNPAGLMKLENGFHVSLSNQTIFQTRKIESTYPYLNSGSYTGKVTAPFFPSIYAVYKLDKLAFSIGFVPIGGGGGAEYKTGLPSFEMSPSDLVPALAASQGATAYRLNVYFKGSSTFLGYQGAVSYKINDCISLAAGARYVTAKNTYSGYLKDIEVNIASGWTRADLIMTGIATSAGAGGANLQPIITAGAGSFTADQLVGAGQMTLAQRNAIVNGLTSLGVSNPASLTISQSQTAFYGAQAKYTGTATLLADQSADVTQTGSGVSPFFSVNISPSENLDIAIKYEMATKLELTNKTTKDLLIGYTATGTPITEFPDGEKVRNDMPALLTIGVDYKLSKLKISIGGDYYFDKTADYGHMIDADLNSSTPVTHIANKNIIANNGMSVEGGLEYNITDKFLVSGGYVYANKGVNSQYQSDLTYGLATHTFGAGGAYSINENIKINLGASYTLYMDDSKTVHHFLGTLDMQPKETYSKSTILFGIGLDMKF